MRNVVLTGFMGTGKTTVGRLLAARLGFEFVDTDALIAERHGPIPVIFARDGEATFRQYERELAAELAGRTGLVVATGGRLMLDLASAAALGDGADVFCLTADLDTVLARVMAADVEERPLLAGPDVEERVRLLLETRAAGYAQFEQVPTDARTPEAVVDDIVTRLQSRERDTRTGG